MVYRPKPKPSCCHYHFSIQSRQVPCAEAAAPSRKATQTPPISHRFVSTIYIYCGSKNFKKDRKQESKFPSQGMLEMSHFLWWTDLREQQQSLAPPPKLLLGAEGMLHSRLCQGLCLLCWKKSWTWQSCRHFSAAFPPPNQYLKLQWEKMATFWYKII